MYEPKIQNTCITETMSINFVKGKSISDSIFGRWPLFLQALFSSTAVISNEVVGVVLRDGYPLLLDRSDEFYAGYWPRLAECAVLKSCPKMPNRFCVRRVARSVSTDSWEHVCDGSHCGLRSECRSIVQHQND